MEISVPREVCSKMESLVRRKSNRAFMWTDFGISYHAMRRYTSAFFGVWTSNYLEFVGWNQTSRWYNLRHFIIRGGRGFGEDKLSGNFPSWNIAVFSIT